MIDRDEAKPRGISKTARGASIDFTPSNEGLREAGRACTYCGDTEPHHVHDAEGQRIEDYFTVGRGQTEFQAAQSWRAKYEKCRRALATGEPEQNVTKDLST